MQGCFATCTRCLVVCWCCLRCFAILFCDAFSATCTLCTLASLWCFLHIVCSFKIACYGQRGWTLFDQQTNPTLYFVWNKGWVRSRKWLFSIVKRSWNVNFLHRTKTSWEVNFFCEEIVEPQTVFGTQERKSPPHAFHCIPAPSCDVSQVANFTMQISMMFVPRSGSMENLDRTGSFLLATHIWYKNIWAKAIRRATESYGRLESYRVLLMLFYDIVPWRTMTVHTEFRDLWLYG